MAVWPHRVPSLEATDGFAHNPEALANKVYGGRMGNVEPDDGWRFRGRTPIMLTGRAAYERMGELSGQDLTVTPELAEGPIYGMQFARLWWEGSIPDSMLSDTVQCRRRVNGGDIGLAHCQALADLAIQVFA
jgi:putative chitinase